MHLNTMRRLLGYLGVGAALVCGAAQADQTPASCSAYAGKLAAMTDADTALRARQDFLAPPEDPEQLRRSSQLDLVERSNGLRLRALLADCGWPLRSAHGEQAGQDAWKLSGRPGRTWRCKRWRRFTWSKPWTGAKHRGASWRSWSTASPSPKDGPSATAPGCAR